MKSHQETDPGDTQTLYRKALDAFVAADEAARTKPQPGSPAWRLWQSLAQRAVAANDAFIARLIRRRT